MVAYPSLTARRSSPCWGLPAFPLHHPARRRPAVKGLRMHKGESRSWIYLGNPRSSRMWNTLTIAAILVLASPPSPDMLSSVAASWVSLQGEVLGRSGDKQLSVPCSLTESSCLYFPYILLELLRPCTLLYSCALIKMENCWALSGESRKQV